MEHVVGQLAGRCVVAREVGVHDSPGLEGITAEPTTPTLLLAEISRNRGPFREAEISIDEAWGLRGDGLTDGVIATVTCIDLLGFQGYFQI